MSKGKSKKDQDLDDDFNFEIVENILDAASKMPKEIYLSLILSYCWSLTHKGRMNEGDLVLGSIGGFTLPSALQGGETANLWAVGYLSGLGFNFIDVKLDDVVDQVQSESVQVQGPAGDFISGMTKTSSPLFYLLTRNKVIDDAAKGMIDSQVQVSSPLYWLLRETLLK